MPKPISIGLSPARWHPNSSVGSRKKSPKAEEGEEKTDSDESRVPAAPRMVHSAGPPAASLG